MHQWPLHRERTVNSRKTINLLADQFYAASQQPLLRAPASRRSWGASHRSIINIADKAPARRGNAVVLPILNACVNPKSSE